jgi:hypothetical protein
MCFSLVTKLQNKILSLQQKNVATRNVYQTQYVGKTVADQNYVNDEDICRYNS